MGAFVVTNYFGRMDFYVDIDGKKYTVKTSGPEQTVAIYLWPGKYKFSLTFPATYAIRCEKLNGCTVEIRAGETVNMPIY